MNEVREGTPSLFLMCRAPRHFSNARSTKNAFPTRPEVVSRAFDEHDWWLVGAIYLLVMVGLDGVADTAHQVSRHIKLVLHSLFLFFSSYRQITSSKK